MQKSKKKQQVLLLNCGNNHVFFLFLELFRSMSGEELERLVLNGIAENSNMTDNDINLLSSQEDFDLESLIGR